MAPVTFGLSPGLDCCTGLEPVHHSRINGKIGSAEFLKFLEPFKSIKNTMSVHFKAGGIGLDPACRWCSLKLQICFDFISETTSSVYFASFHFPLSSNLKMKFSSPPAFSSSEVLVSVFERWLDLRNKENKFTLFRGQLSSSRSLWSKNIRHILRIVGVNKCLQADLSLYLCRHVDGREAVF